MKTFFPTLATALCVICLGGCGDQNDQKPAASTTATPARHEHKPPHGGTAVVLGDEEYHLEFVLDPAAGKLDAYVLDGEMENFVRVAAASLDVTVKLPGREEKLSLNPVANSATGEKLGDSSMFEAQADWLKTTKTFDAVLSQLSINGMTYQSVAFNFPKGNDTDAQSKK